MGKDEKITMLDVYKLVDEKTENLEKKLDAMGNGRVASLEAKVASMEGKQMMVPILISIAINVFGIIVSFVLTK